MLELLFGIIVAIILIIVLAIWGSNDCEWYNIIASIFAVLLGIVTAVVISVYCTLIWRWQAAEQKAIIINREYNTNYTRAEVFYASDVIDTIRELDRKRIELNGNIMQDKK